MPTSCVLSACLVLCEDMDWVPSRFISSSLLLPSSAFPGRPQSVFGHITYLMMRHRIVAWNLAIVMTKYIYGLQSSE